MTKEVQDKINELKKDKNIFIKYIKSFIKIEKVKSLYKNDLEFKKIEKFVIEKDN